MLTFTYLFVQLALNYCRNMHVAGPMLRHWVTHDLSSVRRTPTNLPIMAANWNILCGECFDVLSDAQNPSRDVTLVTEQMVEYFGVKYHFSDLLFPRCQSQSMLSFRYPVTEMHQDAAALLHRNFPEKKDHQKPPYITPEYLLLPLTRSGRLGGVRPRGKNNRAEQCKTPAPRQPPTTTAAGGDVPQMSAPGGGCQTRGQRGHGARTTLYLTERLSLSLKVKSMTPVVSGGLGEVQPWTANARKLQW